MRKGGEIEPLLVFSFACKFLSLFALCALCENHFLTPTSLELAKSTEKNVLLNSGEDVWLFYLRSLRLCVRDCLCAGNGTLVRLQINCLAHSDILISKHNVSIHIQIPLRSLCQVIPLSQLVEQGPVDEHVNYICAGKVVSGVTHSLAAASQSLCEGPGSDFWTVFLPLIPVYRRPFH